METGKLPCWIRNYLTPEEAKAVSHSVHLVEKTTRGEVVPVIVRASTPVKGVAFSAILFFVALFGFIDLHFFPQYDPMSFLAAMILAFAVGWGSSFLACVQRFFLPELDERKACHERAELEFYRNGVHKTFERTGILIFISLLERKVIVLADEGVARVLPEEAWAEIVNELVTCIRDQKLGKGLTRAIEECGKLLSIQFPQSETNLNELKNDLVIKV